MSDVEKERMRIQSKGAGRTGDDNRGGKPRETGKERAGNGILGRMPHTESISSPEVRHMENNNGP